MKKDYLIFMLPASIIIILDQITKMIIAGSINHYDSVKVIDGFFNLVNVRNRGMAFGLMNRADTDLPFFLLSGATFIAILLILYWFKTLKGGDRKLIFGLSLILGGATGNFIDRIRLREVIDFLDFFIGTYHWPAFNIADSSISLGTFWIVINVLFFNSHEKQSKNNN